MAPEALVLSRQGCVDQGQWNIRVGNRVTKRAILRPNSQKRQAVAIGQFELWRWWIKEGLRERHPPQRKPTGGNERQGGYNSCTGHIQKPPGLGPTCSHRSFFHCDSGQVPLRSFLASTDRVV